MSESKDTTPIEFALTSAPRSREEERRAKKNASNRRYRELHREEVNAREKIYRDSHKEAAAARSKAWREANRERFLLLRVSGHMRRKYGLTPRQRDAMIETQGNRCLCCRTKFGILKDNKPRVDHDHETGRVRGILCNSCNTTLGHAKDNLKLLRALVRYLERTNSCP